MFLLKVDVWFEKILLEFGRNGEREKISHELLPVKTRKQDLSADGFGVREIGEF